MSRHTMSHADRLFFGSAQHNGYENALRGILMTPLTKISLGTPVVADADRILDDAAAIDSAGEFTTFLAQPDVPRNITVTGSADSTHVILVHGKNTYGELMTEQLTLDGTNLVSGAKAFAELFQVNVAAGPAGDTFDMGVGDVLGIPFRCDEGDLIMALFDGVPDLSDDALGTIVNAVTTDPATATTGDVRGTYDPNGTLNGSTDVSLLLAIDATSRLAAFGVSQFSGL